MAEFSDVYIKNLELEFSKRMASLPSDGAEITAFCWNAIRDYWKNGALSSEYVPKWFKIAHNTTINILKYGNIFLVGKASGEFDQAMQTLKTQIVKDSADAIKEFISARLGLLIINKCPATMILEATNLIHKHITSILATALGNTIAEMYPEFSKDFVDVFGSTIESGRELFETLAALKDGLNILADISHYLPPYDNPFILDGPSSSYYVVTDEFHTAEIPEGTLILDLNNDGVNTISQKQSII